MEEVLVQLLTGIKNAEISRSYIFQRKTLIQAVQTQRDLCCCIVRLHCLMHCLGSSPRGHNDVLLDRLSVTVMLVSGSLLCPECSRGVLFDRVFDLTHVHTQRYSISRRQLGAMPARVPARALPRALPRALIVAQSAVSVCDLATTRDIVRHVCRRGRLLSSVLRANLTLALPGTTALRLLGSWKAVCCLGSQAPLSKDPRVARVGKTRVGGSRAP